MALFWLIIFIVIVAMVVVVVNHESEPEQQQQEPKKSDEDVLANALFLVMLLHVVLHLAPHANGVQKLLVDLQMYYS